MKRKFARAGLRSAALAIVVALPAMAQQPAPPAAPDPHAGHQMPAADASQDSTAMPAHDHSQMLSHGDMNKAGMYLMRMASGTSMNPQSWPMPMLMPKLGSWSMMIMGEDYLDRYTAIGSTGRR